MSDDPTLEVCVDCAMAIEGYPLDVTEERMKEIEKGLEGRHWYLLGETIGFSRYRCDCCYSPLGGSREVAGVFGLG